MANLQQAADLIYSEGIPMPGVEVPQDEAVRIMRKHFPYFEYCLVRDWIWIDLDLTPEQSAAFARNQRKPSLIFAHTVIYDSSRRFDVGDLVRTSPLYKWEEGFIFATLNSAYLLMGDGVRKRASLETVASFFDRKQGLLPSTANVQMRGDHDG
ncbi:DUF6957 family protein [Ectopseudomonas oleovorans]|uniref:DUF6957 family protein n=1 Tax=Ectopseudomonas oleovorans TaxID=301 RepID=UPI00244A862C|nr:hypothetical protein [Pseudomonas oleovorans]MDH2200916.1 hypothetical protein [Pseudomonas oleovorans]